jgi:Polyketide cyclase / dehydrase and lipid transport
VPRQGWTIDIEAPAERVFSYITDPSLSRRWVHGSFTYEHLNELRACAGSRARISIESNGYRKVIEQEIVKFESNRFIETHGRCRIKNQGRALPEFSFEQSYELVDHGNSCTLIWRYRMVGFARVWGAFSALLYGTEREPAQAELERLKHAIEAE